MCGLETALVIMAVDSGSERVLTLTQQRLQRAVIFIGSNRICYLLLKFVCCVSVTLDKH